MSAGDDTLFQTSLFFLFSSAMLTRTNKNIEFIVPLPVRIINLSSDILDLSLFHIRVITTLKYHLCNVIHFANSMIFIALKN